MISDLTAVEDNVVVVFASANRLSPIEQLLRMCERERTLEWLWPISRAPKISSTIGSSR